MCPCNHYIQKNLFSVLIFCLLLLVTAQITFAAGTTSTGPSHSTLVGEELSFDIGFWVFKKAAQAHMTMQQSGNEYIAVIEAKTNGLVGFLARNLKETMKSIMHYDAQSGKFKPVYFEEVLIQGNKVRKKTVSFNHDKKTFTVTHEGSSRKTTAVTRSLPHKACDDLLTAFYNFRLGSYGEITWGKSFPITICVKQGPSRLVITIPQDHTIGKHGPCTAEYCAAISMDKDLTHIASKQITGWLSKDLVPQCGVVKDAYFFGDLTVQLKERNFIK
jgi:hypothetical protein